MNVHGGGQGWMPVDLEALARALTALLPPREDDAAPDAPAPDAAPDAPAVPQQRTPQSHVVNRAARPRP